MILNALVRYYESLADRGEIARPGWGKAKISLALELDGDGTLLRIHSLKEEETRGKKMVSVPRVLELPAPVKRTAGVSSNFLWDNGVYLLGLDGKGNPERAQKCFAAAALLHETLLAPLEDPYARAIRGFFARWDCAAAPKDSRLAPFADELLSGGNLTFLFENRFPQECPALRSAWQRHYDGDGAPEQAEHLRCLVTGIESVPEAVHPSIKGVRGAQSSGAALVSFNALAFCSYGREQNLNAPMSKYAAFAYTTALNHLLADSRHTVCAGKTTVVFWAEDGESAYQDFFGTALNGESITDDDLRAILTALTQGKRVDWAGVPLESRTRFYILGLSPNAARLSVRFFLQNSFGAFAFYLRDHYERLDIVRPAFDRFAYLPLWRLLSETVNQNSRDKEPSPQMAGDTLCAILTGARYPATLYQQTQLRIRAEREVTRGRAAILKAYLLRNTDEKRYKEALQVQLNDSTTYQPYVLGRLFSVLEGIQQQANPGINATIKDKYFSSACATPAVAFPTLLNLAEKHLKKMESNQRIYYARQLGALTALITESYPVHHSLYDQGIFQLGYYHQTQKRFEKKDRTQRTEEETSNE